VMGVAQWSVWIINLTEIAIILADHFNSPLVVTAEAYLCPSKTASGPDRLTVTISFFLAWVVLMAGGLLRAACYRTLGEFFTFRVAVRKDHKLITSGPYAYVRHPAYLGGATFIVALIHALFARGSYLSVCQPVGWSTEAIVMFIHCFIFLPATFTRAVTEDALMKKKFGKEWEEWARNVRYRVCPGIW